MEGLQMPPFYVIVNLYRRQSAFLSIQAFRRYFPIDKKLLSAGQARSVMHIGLKSIKFRLTFAWKYTMIINRKRTFVRIGG